MVQIVDALPWHVGKLKENLRPEDAAELLRLGMSIDRALWRSYKESIVRKTAFVDGQVAAMWGVRGDIMSRSGMVWLLTSPQVNQVSPLRFARIYQDQVYKMLNIFPYLENYCDASYTAAIRLLEIIGFTVYPPEPVGKDGAMFSRFTIERA